MAQIVTIPPEVGDALTKFRGSSPPLICYIDRKSEPPVVKIDAELFEDDEDFSIEELASRLPNAPRYIVLNYKSDSQSFPKVIFINWIPSGCQTVASMLHVGTLPVIEDLARHPKVIEVSDGEEGLTKEIIEAKLSR